MNIFVAKRKRFCKEEEEAHHQTTKEAGNEKQKIRKQYLLVFPYKSLCKNESMIFDKCYVEYSVAF